MSIPANSEWRGAAAFFTQPVSQTDLLGAQHLVEYVYNYNCIHPPQGVPALADVEYRSSERELDILRHVYRWDDAPPEYVFANGFRPRRQDGTPDSTYFSIETYVNSGGRPLDSRRPVTYAFVSTTLNSGWFPSLSRGEDRRIYRYEVYAPGGIWVAETLGDNYRYPSQDEVCFTAGIAPLYVRSAQQFRLYCPDRYTRRERVDTVLIVNTNFNPQLDPQRNLRIQRPVVDYLDANRIRHRLQVRELPPRSNLSMLQKRSTNNNIIDYYTSGVADEVTYIDSAFRSTTTNEAYIFMKKEYVLVNYAPGTANDYIVNGPLYIGDGFPSLDGTPFVESGIDCAFSCPGVNEAFIFSGKLCAKINYAPGTTKDSIIEGPKTIANMFPFFKNKEFEGGCDAAFESTRENEAYIFSGNLYALVNFAERRLIAIRPITDGFPCLAPTKFASGIGAAFASHRSNEAYLFKDEYYALLYFNPGTTGDYISGGNVKEIGPNWPGSFGKILPRKNRGLDIYEFPK